MGDMEYRQTDGVARRVHKQYVDVLARICAGGSVVPVAVCWLDGRCFYIDEILGQEGFGIDVQGYRTSTYRIRFGGHETELNLEHFHRDDPVLGPQDRLRWWVWAFDRTRSKSA